MNIKKIKELVELMNENELTEVEIELEGMKVKLKKGANGVIEPIAPAVIKQQAPVVQAAPAPQEEEAPANIKEVKAPMVGTFYRSPSPDESPYVDVGDIVKDGDVLCIVEAMKLMNEIKAEFGGRITEICVRNAESVEFGQTLFKVEIM